MSASAALLGSMLDEADLDCSLDRKNGASAVFVPCTETWSSGGFNMPVDALYPVDILYIEPLNEAYSSDDI